MLETDLAIYSVLPRLRKSLFHVEQSVPLRIFPCVDIRQTEDRTSGTPFHVKQQFCSVFHVKQRYGEITRALVPRETGK
jgi:hypothetical protein